MKLGTKLRIRNQWNLNEENHPDSSTEFLLQLTADQCGVEVNVVAMAIDDGGGIKMKLCKNCNLYTPEIPDPLLGPFGCNGNPGGVADDCELFGEGRGELEE